MLIMNPEIIRRVSSLKSSAGLPLSQLFGLILYRIGIPTHDSLLQINIYT